MKKLLQSIVLLLAVLAVPVTANAQDYGDVNGDGEVTVADINVVIDVILGRISPSAAVDLNGDGEVTIADINAVIEVIVGGAISPGEDPMDIPEDIMAMVKNAGMTINYGNNPPNVDGTFIMDPIDTRLVGPFNTWIPYGDEEEGYLVEFEEITKLIVMFQSHDDNLVDALTVPFYSADEYDPDDITYFEDMSIMGNGKKFTISTYFAFDFIFPDETIGMIFSGEVDGQNIKNFQFASIEVIPDPKNGTHVFIAILDDHDGISYRTNWEPDDYIHAPRTSAIKSFIKFPMMKRMLTSQLLKSE